MKKSKVLALTVLSVILCLMIMCTSSFSWFTRGTQTGGYFSWTNDDSNTALSYNTSNGSGISMVTYSSPDGNTYGDKEVTALSNSNGLAAGDRKYYRTDITNSGSTDQSVSLYLSNLETSGNGKFYLGVNDPLKTYKNYNVNITHDSGTKTQRNVMRVYFQPKGVWSVTDYYVCYTDNSKNTFLKMLSVNNGTYCADIPNTTTKFYFANANNVTSDNGRTPDISPGSLSQTKSVVYWLTGGEDGYKNKLYSSSDEVTGANILEYYSSVNLLNGSSFSIALASDKYTGNAPTYTSNNSDVCTVDSSGKITAKKSGSASITISVKGVSYGETLSVTCDVTVGENMSDIPVVTNLKVPAKGDKDTVVSVYWYIKNDSDSGNLTYSIDDLYLSL